MKVVKAALDAGATKAGNGMYCFTEDQLKAYTYAQTRAECERMGGLLNSFLCFSGLTKEDAQGIVERAKE